jgi:hypothetical protein
VRLGRDPSGEVCLADPQVSGRHAEIRQDAAGWVLSDLGSRNGTWLNGQRILTPCRLSDGDEIVVGNTRLTFGQLAGAGGGPAPFTPTAPMPPGAALPVPGGAAPPPVPWGGGAIVPQPTAPGPQAGAARGPLAALFAPKAVGTIAFEPKEAQEDAPRDLSRTLVTLSVMLAFFGVLAAFIGAMLAVSIVLICLGAGALLFIVPFLLLLLKMPFDMLMNGLRQQKPVTVVRFRMDDDLTRGPVDVVLRRKMGEGGCVFQGDRVQVWGKRKSGTLVASQVRVESSGATVRAQRPWPLAIGLLTVGSVVAGLVLLAMQLGLIEVSP